MPPALFMHAVRVRIEQRISEAARLGFEKIFISSYNKENLPKSVSDGLEIRYVSKVEDVFSQLLV